MSSNIGNEEINLLRNMKHLHLDNFQSLVRSLENDKAFAGPFINATTLLHFNESRFIELSLQLIDTY